MFRFPSTSLARLTAVFTWAAILILAGTARAGAEPTSSAKDRQDAMRWAMEGSRLKPEATQALESRLATRADDLEARARLLGYYSRLRTDVGREARVRHVLWLIEHRPDAAITGMPPAELDPVLQAAGYKKAETLWRTQVAKHAKNPATLGNGATFFAQRAPDEAEKLLRQAKQLEPENTGWARRLAQLYKQQSQAGIAGAATKALDALREAQDKTTEPMARWILLTDLAQAAFAAKANDQAKDYASRLLDDAPKFEKSWAYGDALHHGHLVLGRLALQKGDLDEAKRRLAQAGKTPGSPTLNSFGPNMSLARDLMQKGERDAVVSYLKLCESFWKGGKQKLQDWAELVRNGRTPDFGANLNY